MKQLMLRVKRTWRSLLLGLVLAQFVVGCALPTKFLRDDCNRFLAEEIIGDPLLDLRADNMETWLQERLGYTHVRKMFEGNRFEFITLSDEFKYYELDATNPRWPYPFSIEMLFQDGEPLFVGIYTAFQPDTLKDLERCVGTPALYEAYHNMEKTPSGAVGKWSDSYLALWYPEKHILAVRTASTQLNVGQNEKNLAIPSPKFAADDTAAVMLYYVSQAGLQRYASEDLIALIGNLYHPVMPNTRPQPWPGTWEEIESTLEP